MDTCDETRPDEHSQKSFGLKAKKRKKSEPTAARIILSAGRKDRHSKVCTAMGTRDRRVRLAPKTAIQFYDVQDRLGCDRPSKAIDWLMREAKAAIDALELPLPPTDAANSSNSLNCTAAFANSQPPDQNFGFFMNSSEFQVYSDPGSFAWNYGTSPPPAFGHSQVQFSPREPLQSSFSRVSNHNPNGVELRNEDFAPAENRDQADNIQFSSAAFLH